MYEPTLTSDDDSKAVAAQQQREFRFWESRAEANSEIVFQTVDSAPLTSLERHPWNSTWYCYDWLLAYPILGKRALVVGCGYGDDAIRIAMLGADVEAFDISPKTVAIAQQRAHRFSKVQLNVRVAATEAMPYESETFDLIFANVVLHHCSLQRALTEIVRVTKPGGSILLREPYMHSVLQKVRRTRFVRNLIGIRVASEDERPLDERDLRTIRALVQAGRSPSSMAFPIAWSQILTRRSAWRKSGFMQLPLGAAPRWPQPLSSTEASARPNCRANDLPTPTSRISGSTAM
jgi:SAM-dependent methyltransferase